MTDYSIIDLFNLVEQTALPTFADTEKYASLDDAEINAINKKLMQIAENDEVFGALWEARNAIYDAVRAVKKWTHTNFVGFGAEGRDLDLNILEPDDVVKNGTALTTFVQDVTAGTAYYWSGANNGKVSLGMDEAIVIVGWYDPVDSPKAIRILAELPKKNVIIDSPFYMNKDVPLIIHEPITLNPQDSFDVQVRYNEDGTDSLMPVGVHVRMASSRSL